MMQGLKVLALFLGYGTVGMGGDYAAEAWAGRPSHDVMARVMPDVQADVEVDVDRDGRWSQSGECRYEARRSVTLDASSARALAVRAGSGDLEVTGVAGTDRVEAVARACASDEEALEELTLTLDREGERLVLEAHYPDRSGWNRRGDQYARLDLVVEFPRGLAVDVDDSSGGMTVRGTGDLRIDDSSGSILVEDVAGSLTIDDSSGEVDVVGVEGDVSVDDGSGEIRISGVGGTVELRDGSGSVEVDDVKRDVVVLNDGSGSISVRGVGGDFRVRSDGSGGIRHSDVAGVVDIPQKKRRGRGN